MPSRQFVHKYRLPFLLIVILIAGGTYFSIKDDKNTDSGSELSNTDNQSRQPADHADQNSSSEIQENPLSSETSNNIGAYIDYQSGIIEKTPGTKILFFHAPWCPQCRDLEASIKAGTIPANTTIIKVDYDSNQSLRQTYGVTIQTSLVQVDNSGMLLKKYVAYDDPSLKYLLDNRL